MLHHTVEGTGSSRVVLVHGFTQTGRTWDDVAAHLAGDAEVVRVDLPGHGGSADVRLDFEKTAAALGDAGGPATYVGYSMGGRLCLRLALDRPHLVSALVLLGASPGVADAGERAERRHADLRLALDIEDIGTDEFLHHWLGQPMFETLVPRPADMEARRANRPDGLAAALRSLGTGYQEPLWDRLPRLDMPVLLVVGSEDAKFVGIAERMKTAIGDNARVVVLPGAGHAVHLDRPQECADLVKGVF
ncbi:MAG: alpha/beta fold hydrolase [Actinomycetota bacterium]|nr:alpha/beta fold hydrolase [Actinomycetota bacterium]